MSDYSRYLRYLPAIYSTVATSATDTNPAFLGQYLKIFEKILTGIADAELNQRKGIQELLAADVIGNLFYSRLSFLFPATDTSFIPPISSNTKEEEAALLSELNTYIGVPEIADPLAAYIGNVANTPAASSLAGTIAAASTPEDTENTDGIAGWLNDFLIWLGSWVDLVVENGWSIDKKRLVIAEIMALYRMRGTVQGISFLLNLLLDLPLTLSGQQTDPAQPAPSGPLSVTVRNPVVPNIMLTSQVGEQTFILQQSWSSGSAVVSGYLPWLFEVEMTLPNANQSVDGPEYILTRENVAQIERLYHQLQQVLLKIRPAASQFKISIVPSMQLQADGQSTQLGINTLLGNQGETDE